MGSKEPSQEGAVSARGVNEDLGERTKAVSLCYVSDEGSREDGWKSLVRTIVGERYCESAEDASGDPKERRGEGNSGSEVVAKMPGDTAGGGRQEQQPSKASRSVTGIHSATRGKFHTYAVCHDFHPQRNRTRGETASVSRPSAKRVLEPVSGRLYRSRRGRGLAYRRRSQCSSRPLSTSDSGRRLSP